MLLIIPIQITVFVLWPMPTTAEQWIHMSREHPLLSVVHLDVLYVINNALICIIYVGLFAILIREQGGLALLGLVTGLIGAAAYFPTVRPTEVVRISCLYHAATDSALRRSYLVVVEGMIRCGKEQALLRTTS